MTQVSQETMMFKRNNENKDVSQTISEVCKALDGKDSSYSIEKDENNFWNITENGNT